MRTATAIKPAIRLSKRSAPMSNATRFIAHASEVASFYGFRPVREIERMTRERNPQLKRANPLRALSFADAAQVCMDCSQTRPLEPILGFYATPLPSHTPHGFPRDTAEFGLQVAATPESIGEVLILKTAATILAEWGSPITRIRLNCMGDRDSQQRFARELALYVRRRSEEFDEPCREKIVQNMYAPYHCQNETCRAVLSEGPRAMTFLSEKSRLHFREVLEHLESLGLPYELDDLLAGDEREPRVLFRFDIEGDSGVVLGATGGRYDDFVRKMTGRKEGHTVHASIFFDRAGAKRPHFAAQEPKRRPRIYFVQLGLRAKLQGLAVVDMLRHARISVLQSFDTSHLSHQLAAAQGAGVPYMLIMGQREALDGTVIVRSTRNGEQTIVALAQLPKFLRNIKI